MNEASSMTLTQPAQKLLKAAGLAQDFQLLPMTGGANNKVFQVALTGGALALLKVYSRHPDDSRDRLGVEFAFSSFAWGSGVRSLPRPLGCDDSHHLGLYEFVEGDSVRPEQVTQEYLRQALQFLRALNEHRESPQAQALPAASEACFSVADHLRCVERRLQALKAIKAASPVQQTAYSFIHKELSALWDRVREQVVQQARELRLGLEEEIPRQDRRLSPSDFGFHNALITKEGRLRFIDFEYAGWDDPVKTACDLFCLQGVKVPEIYFESFVRGVVEDLSDPENSFLRAKLLRVVHQVKWCCILLNDFLPAGSQRRRFADPSSPRGDREAGQLKKAQAALEEMR